jgi:sporulation protein YabP
MAEERKIPVGTNGQDVSIINREKARITGVLDVHSFDENLVSIETELGEMVLRGENLKISKLNLEQFELMVEGYICTCEYENRSKKDKGMFSRMFK